MLISIRLLLLLPEIHSPVGAAGVKKRGVGIQNDSVYWGGLELERHGEGVGVVPVEPPPDFDSGIGGGGEEAAISLVER